MNKKAMIMPLEIIKLVIAVFIGLGFWFIYSGVKDWAESTFTLSASGSIVTGLFILGVAFIFIKYKPHNFVIG